ncbi:His Kinase A (phospho-acceptor) domain-containing protein [Geoalkalibacter ferrihydriticus]|uniref:histidine kinase n=1 Tax=Geoalkalibacter ferrihydriticus TaxID=392333 RepID=A0A1G9JRL5_9BACT|nr:ATP-binding protein [Geoalkalibacter ferrihydriticus]SDL40061.1 His Kinase A (phospho-acceptor) domain-containing protein [Geoalkalibacter ferrihydriticus]
MAGPRLNKGIQDAADLRRLAEEKLRLAKGGFQKPPPDQDARRLVHELQVHQIELQMQNNELRQSRDELEAANIELDAFNHTLAHDLRQHLMTINGYCQVIQSLDSTERAEKTTEYLEEIYQGSLAMSRLIDTLLDFSSVANGEVHRQSVDLSAIAKSLVKEQILAADACRCTFHVTPGIRADADPDLLRVVLNNLIGNAYKYAGNRAGVVIEFGVTSVDGKRACFVRDNGPGFDMAYADRLFLPFQRLPGTALEGHGIGLATVERIVRRHGGRVWAESEKGQGATFFFTLD